jgi:hypothetical protein
MYTPVLLSIQSIIPLHCILLTGSISIAMLKGYEKLDYQIDFFSRVPSWNKKKVPVFFIFHYHRKRIICFFFEDSMDEWWELDSYTLICSLNQAPALLLLLLTPVIDPRTNMEIKRFMSWSSILAFNSYFCYCKKHFSYNLLCRQCAVLLKIVRLQGRVDWGRRCANISF